MGAPHFPQRVRPRRNRNTPAMRSLVREAAVTVSNLVYPLFVTQANEGGRDKIPIPSMPGIYRHNLQSLMKEIDECYRCVYPGLCLYYRII